VLEIIFAVINRPDAFHSYDCTAL